jgi:hypothetical protein
VQPKFRARIGAATGFHLKFTTPAPYIDRQVKEMLQ